MNPRRSAEFGDFQTPDALAICVCNLLRQQGEEPDAVVEPTVGRGAFLTAAANAFPSAILRGWDIHAPYVCETEKRIAEKGAADRSAVVCGDFFACDWERQFEALSGRVLILGNPPWITNSAVAALNGSNVPTKSNFLGLRGIAARTGKSNFDIAEWMLIRLLHALGKRPATFAMLCKTVTARKFLRYAWQNDGRVTEAAIYRIDAGKHFDASVDACLLLARTGTAGPECAAVFGDLNASKPMSYLGLAGKDLVPDMDTYRTLQHLEGLSPFRWRSGIKHDCASVMELRQEDDGGLLNGLGERVNIEREFLYPLLKCTNLARSRTRPDLRVLVTQRSVGEDTSHIASTAPLTWSYLQMHASRFSARKSSIYRNRAPFSLFGIGDYSFSPWKVAVSGLHRMAVFQVVGPFEERPVFFDDTCYFLPFHDQATAQLVADVLNSGPCQRFLSCMVFSDAKRPFTVDRLQRLNLGAIAEDAGLHDRWSALQQYCYEQKNVPAQSEFVMEAP